MILMDMAPSQEGDISKSLTKLPHFVKHTIDEFSMLLHTYYQCPKTCQGTTAFQSAINTDSDIVEEQ